MRFAVHPSLLLIATVALLPSGGPALAQCLLCATRDANADSDGANAGSAGEDRPLRVDIIADLDFARLIAGASGGSARIDPLQGGMSVSGDVRMGSGMGFSGRLMVSGTPGRMVRITMPDSAILTSSSGGRVEIAGVSSGQAPVQRIGPDGRLEIPFGGSLRVSGAIDGDFRGRIAVTVSYE